MAHLARGTTKVIQHQPGKAVQRTPTIPSHMVEIGELALAESDCGSRIGGNPCMLQNERLANWDMKFAIQLRSADFPGKFTDVFGVPDALGYLFLRECSVPSEEDGLFFVQTT